ncbi:hypothetical protein HHL23_19010 [Chryseobacterium sp. RP-3-3]|uniref:Uncharacterized protein n=1 Tax=Chryseobacterium antibioticum TaxID=2728847 RepID=A0A7Y0AR48_9FLAO|nr:hypothetical protein [Chryseobacterium antibioticum]NML71869.1 hypothetical protein [Chryseobacterium antibioticum]
MMKKNNYLLLILSVFLFFGCRQESLYVDQESQNNSTLKNYVINGNEIKKDVNLWSKLSGIQTRLFSTDLKNKKNDPLLDGAVIMTDYAGVMEKNGVTTYTFAIKRIYPSKDIENLVVRKNIDGSYSGLLMQYHLSKQELQAFQNAGKPEDIKGKISVYKINDSNLNSKDSSGGYTYSEQIGCLVINYEVIPCTSSDQHTNPNQCALTGVDSPQIILMSVDDTHCNPSGNQGGSSSGSGTVSGGNQGGSGSSTNNPPANPYNTFIFDSFDDMYNTCASGDAACEAERQLNLQVQAYLLSLSPTKSMLASYSPILQTIKGYFKTHGSADDTLTDRLALTANWFNAQNNTNPDLTLSNFKFAHWALIALLESDTQDFQNFFNRLNALNDAVAQNPNRLLDIPCSELDDWQTVAQHNVPQSVKEKLQNIKNQTSWWSNWQITNLDDGASARINMDVFPVQINSLPNKPNSNQKYSPEEFFNFFRLNLNVFAEKFTPIVDSYYGINDTALWNSSNPLGALIHIEIPIDNGTVICSGFGPKAWVFSTIKAPMSMGYDGVHPVAGNRLFGYYVDPSNNTMYIFTRGVDRVSQVATSSPNLANYLISASAFLGADQLWKGMQDKLSKYINDRGGNANKLPEKTYRPNYTKIRNFLKGTAPLSSLGCN